MRKNSRKYLRKQAHEFRAKRNAENNEQVKARINAMTDGQRGKLFMRMEMDGEVIIS